MEKVESKDELKHVLQLFDAVFYPPLSDDIKDLDAYADKLVNEAVTYFAYVETKEAGFISFYVADKNQEASFITLIAVLPNYQGQKVAQKLLDKCIHMSRKKGKKKVRLEVDVINERAVSFYKKNDFLLVEETSNHTVYMERVLN